MHRAWALPDFWRERDAADGALTTDPTLAAEMQAARDSFVGTFGLRSRERFRTLLACRRRRQQDKVLACHTL